jgi:hypothetical protein
VSALRHILHHLENGEPIELPNKPETLAWLIGFMGAFVALLWFVPA